MSDVVRNQPDLVGRYLELLKKSLLNEIYAEIEYRLVYLFAIQELELRFEADMFRDISARLPDWVAEMRLARAEGRSWWGVKYALPDGSVKSLDLRNLCQFSHTMVGRKRLDNVQACLDAVRQDGVPGDVAETGVWRGGVAIFMKGYLSAWNMSDRKVWAADSFAGLPVPRHAEDAGYDLSPDTNPILAVSLEDVRENFRRYDLLDEHVVFLKGWFHETLHKAPIERLAILRLDGDLYESTMDALTALYDKLSPGGFVIVDDYGDLEPCRRAVDEFRAARGITETIEQIDWTGVMWRKAQP